MLALSYDVNILVLDTGCIPTPAARPPRPPRWGGGQFSAGGKTTAKKDLARIASDYGHVYVATVAYGAKDVHTLKAFHEAESHDGPSLIVAYSPCIAHGVDMLYNQRQQEMAVKSGHWPLFRRPAPGAAAATPSSSIRPRRSQPIKNLHGQRDPLRDARPSHRGRRRLAAASPGRGPTALKTYQALAAARRPRAGKLK